jgi:hypothetical protein
MELEAVARRRTWSESPTGASGSGSRAGEKGAHVVKIESRDDYRRREWTRDRSIRAQSNPVTEHPPELDQPEPPSYKAAPSGSSWSGYSCC